MSEQLINEGYEVVGIDQVQPHPANPRMGDVGAIYQSIDANGFYGALVVQKSTGNILAGNHRWQAAKHAGLDEIPVLYVDVDDEQAHRILVADNRLSDLGTYDEAQLATILKEIAETPAGLEGTGYDGDDLDDLIAKVEADAKAPEPAPAGEPVIRYELIFDTEDEQTRFHDAIKRLRDQYPDEPTIAARLVMHLEQTLQP